MTTTLHEEYALNIQRHRRSANLLWPPVPRSDTLSRLYFDLLSSSEQILRSLQITENRFSTIGTEKGYHPGGKRGTICSRVSALMMGVYWLRSCRCAIHFCYVARARMLRQIDW
jgi:hypothetical protein